MLRSNDRIELVAGTGKANTCRCKIPPAGDSMKSTEFEGFALKERKQD